MMLDAGVNTALEIFGMYKTAKQVREMVSEINGTVSVNGHKKAMRSTKAKAEWKAAENSAGHYDLNTDHDFPEFGNGSYLANPSEKKALAHYEQAKACMLNLEKLQILSAYAVRVSESRLLQAAEKAKQIAYSATSGGILKVIHGSMPEPVPSLETLVCSEIGVMSDMEKHVRMAIGHSQATVNELQIYDELLVVEFDKAKKSFLSLEKKIAGTEEGIAKLQRQINEMDKEEQNYVPLKQQMDGLIRLEKETLNSKELSAQKVVYTDKQSGLVQTKEDIVRRGLHQLKLVNDYVGSFLNFVQQTRAADAIIPQLLETADVVSESYRILSSIFENENRTTTQAITELVATIKGVKHMVYPNALAEAKRQKETLEGIGNRMTFSEQASRLLRGKNQMEQTNREHEATHYAMQPS